MGYCSIAEVRARIGAPMRDSTSAQSFDSSGNPKTTVRFLDVDVQAAIEAGTKLIDGAIGRYTAIAAASYIAKQLNILFAAYSCLEAEEQETQAAGGGIMRTRAAALKKDFDELMAKAVNSPAMMEGTVEAVPYATEDGPGADDLSGETLYGFPIP